MISNNNINDDEWLARKLQQNEWLPLVNYLEEETVLALKHLLDAADRAADKKETDKLQQKYEQALHDYEITKQKMLNVDSTHFIQNSLQKTPAETLNQPYKVQPLQIFSKEENELIENHYQKIPEILRNLLDVAIKDENIELDIMTNPVFLKGDGHVYDLATVEKIIAKNGKNPFNQNSEFKKEDIIPCNTLIKAIQILLNIISGQDVHNQPVEINDFYQKFLNEYKTQALISTDLINQIEIFYQQLPAKHQRLFDVICRDPVTNMIMDDAVFLPDGYAYNRSTALLLLDSVKPVVSAPCYLDNNISFKKEDMTKCYLINAVYEYLKNMFHKKSETNQVTVMPKTNILKI